MTGTELAKSYHNAISSVADGYGHVLEVLSTENAALRARIAQLEADVSAREKRILDLVDEKSRASHKKVVE